MDVNEKRSVTIINKLGLHARAAAKLVTLADQYPCVFWIEHRGQRINGKSIMGVMMLAAKQGTSLDFIADGERGQDLLDALEALVNNRFGEPE